MLKQRVITALIAVAALLLVLFVLPQAAAQVVVAALVLAGAWEWSGFLGTQSAAVRAVYVAFIGVLMALATWLAPDFNSLVFRVALAWWVCALVWTLFYPTAIPGIVRWVAGVLVLLPLYEALIVLYLASPAVLLGALLIVWAADTGAFVAGKLFGRVKLAPQISPGKTWEGVIGGLLTVAVLAAVGAWLFDLRVAVLVPFCLAVACASIVGDLTVSMFKRTAGLKDSGSLFPGHGGVLDRVDSVAAAAPLFALGIAWTGLQ
ncbi:MAG TPA: phosphatidate cytidylyltransferase [Woeseiaceae bacterium]|nr:phosphatidate cytidylyltransferase [Woeseiaceae bacterium]